MKTKQKNASSGYDEVKAKALAKPLLRILVRLSELKIVGDGVVSYAGNMLHFTEAAFLSLAQLVGTPISFQKRVHGLMGDSAKLNLLNVMREAMSLRKDRRLMLIGNPDTLQIVAVVKEDAVMLTAGSFFDLVEGIVTKYNLNVRACSIDDVGTVNIRTTSPNAETISGLPSKYKENEEFLPGLSFQNGIVSGTELNPFTYRMVCTNGMIAERKSQGAKLVGFDSKELREFYEHVRLLASNNFVPFNYNQNVVRAIQTNASMEELGFAYKTMFRSCENEVDKRLINAFLPYEECVAKYKKMNIHIEELTQQHRRNAKTNVPMWDVVNALTNFATHQHDGIDLSEASRAVLQTNAGDLLGRERYDTELLLPSLV